MHQNDHSSHILSFGRWMPKDEDDEGTSDEDSQTEYHIYHEDSTDTESIDSENSTFEVNDESIQPILSEIISAEPIEASPQSVHLEDNITLRGDDDQPQPEPKEQLGRGHRDRRLPMKLEDYVLSNDSEDYGLLSYQQAISGEEESKWEGAIEGEKEKMSEQYKASTMWAIYSKLCLLRINKGVDIKSFAKVHAFMKAISKNDVAKKAYVFNEDALRKFFIDAPDITYLFLMVVAICGIFGSCRRCELCDLRLHDIKEEGSVLVITMRPSKTMKARRFAVADSGAIGYVAPPKFKHRPSFLTI
ncbi:hypothetical protein JTB14_032158 [Gonioctena quinquepunctata]|nr:hypothetical protein JTB14_032158 [Gonioctena quinquepunctata]